MEENTQQDQGQDQQNQGAPAEQNVAMPENSEKSMGGIIAMIIIVLILIVGGIYVFSGGTTSPCGGALDCDTVVEEILALPDESVVSLDTQGTSDAISEIEADLAATNLDGLDAELEAMEAEIDAAL